MSEFPVYKIIYRNEYDPDIDSIKKALYETKDEP